MRRRNKNKVFNIFWWRGFLIIEVVLMCIAKKFNRLTKVHTYEGIIT
jgi:hypothetical protein